MNMKNQARVALLKLDPKLNRIDGGKKELRDGLSAVVLVGDTLFVACDETTRLDRLVRRSGEVFDSHQAFPLGDYLALPAKEKEEADIEGLDVAGGYLWMVGSHSLKRTNPKPDKLTENRARLAEVTSDGNRFLLARIPLVEQNGLYDLKRRADEEGQKSRVAARLNGDAEGSDLTTTLKQDEHFARFFTVPGKDNGFDIEGLAAASKSRLFLGLRGPVLRGWATVLEVSVREDDADHSTLRLKEGKPGRRPYRKHFLELGGLGVRDLCVDGDDLLILAGPTINLDGPVSVFRWPGGAAAEDDETEEVNETGSMVFAGDLEKILDVPFGKGVDHAEGMTLLPADKAERRSVLILYDAPSDERKRGRAGGGEAVVRADIFTLP